MTLAAAQVRTEVAARLAAVALTAGRVFAGRYYPAAESELPCWFVSLEAEDLEPQVISWPGASQHRLRLRADGYAAGVDGLETLLDTLQAQGLAAVFATQPPWPLRCLGVQRDVSDGEGQDGRTGRVSLVFEAQFVTEEPAPETLIV